MVALTFRLDEELKEALDKFCKAHGMKQQAVVAEAIASWLEDAEDLELIEERRDGPWVEWDDVKDEI
jgi:predicted DNA-binding protein